MSKGVGKRLNINNAAPLKINNETFWRSVACDKLSTCEVWVNDRLLLAI